MRRVRGTLAPTSTLRWAWSARASGGAREARRAGALSRWVVVFQIQIRHELAKTAAKWDGRRWLPSLASRSSEQLALVGVSLARPSFTSHLRPPPSFSSHRPSRSMSSASNASDSDDIDAPQPSSSKKSAAPASSSSSKPAAAAAAAKGKGKGKAVSNEMITSSDEDESDSDLEDAPQAARRPAANRSVFAPRCSLWNVRLMRIASEVATSLLRTCA